MRNSCPAASTKTNPLTAMAKGFIFLCRQKNNGSNGMATYRQTRALTKEEAAYIAGVIDGEGNLPDAEERQIFEGQQLEREVFVEKFLGLRSAVTPCAKETADVS